MGNIIGKGEVVLLDLQTSSYLDVKIFQHTKTKKISEKKDFFSIDYNWKPKALYIVNSDIKDGDWVIDLKKQHVEKYNPNNNYDSYLKLIATNNKYLNFLGVPNVPSEFVDEYIIFGGEIKQVSFTKPIITSQPTSSCINGSSVVSVFNTQPIDKEDVKIWWGELHDEDKYDFSIYHHSKLYNTLSEKEIIYIYLKECMCRPTTKQTHSADINSFEESLEAMKTLSPFDKVRLHNSIVRSLGLEDRVICYHPINGEIVEIEVPK